MTIKELALIVQDGFAKINTRLDKIEIRLDKLEEFQQYVLDVFKRNNLK